MSKPYLITGIDIGNSTVKTVIAEINREIMRPQVLGVGSAPSNGMRRGMVFDMEETTKNIHDSLGVAEAMAGAKIHQAYISINGLHIRTQSSRGVIIVSRADNEITQNDINRVLDASSTINLPPNRELLHVLPRNFTIDAQEHVKNALGMKGVRLEAEVLLIDGLSQYIRNVTKCVNANDVEVLDRVFAPLAASRSILNKHQREDGVLSVDFGGGVSSIALFHEGELVHTATLPIGSKHITYDIAVAFRTSIDRAEEIKCRYGSLDQNAGNKKDQIALEVSGEKDSPLTHKQVAKIIDSRVSELFELISAEIKKLPRQYHLPAGVVLAGGGANLDGLENFTKNWLKLATTRAEDGLLEGLSDQISDPSFAVATGLVAWGFEKEFSDNKQMLSGRLSSDGIKKVGKWFKNFLP